MKKKSYLTLFDNFYKNNKVGDGNKKNLKGKI